MRLTLCPGNVTVDAAVKKLGLKDQHSCVPGMIVSLMPHQFIGVSWMLEYVFLLRLLINC